MPPDAGCNAARIAGEEITKETSPGRFTKRPGLVLDTGVMEQSYSNVTDTLPLPTAVASPDGLSMRPMRV